MKPKEPFERKLDLMSDAFEDWRYAHEKDFLVVSISGLRELAESALAVFDQAVQDA